MGIFYMRTVYNFILNYIVVQPGLYLAWCLVSGHKNIGIYQEKTRIGYFLTLESGPSAIILLFHRLRKGRGDKICPISFIKSTH